MPSITSEEGSSRSLAAAAELQEAQQTTRARSDPIRIGRNARSIPQPSAARLAASLHEQPLDIEDFLQRGVADDETVLYLGYGSNMSNETFRGKRGIKPLAQVNVQVPCLRLTFDLPGLPYKEPCFANSARRDPESDRPSKSELTDRIDEKAPLLGTVRKHDRYRKDRWHKGLIGVVYEVTAKDYAHIIATEGGGSSYHDILVECHPFVSADPSEPVPEDPVLPPFKAHTLFAPAIPANEPPPEDGGRFLRPDPSYAQPSARYLKLMTDGAHEVGLPYEYQDYLHSLRPYTITTKRQRLGQAAFISTWLPLVMAIFGLTKLFTDGDGKSPKWMRQVTGVLFKSVWVSYDRVFKPIYGDGERTTKDKDDDMLEGASAI